MNTLVDVTTSALISRNILEELKRAKIIVSPTALMVSSLLINFLVNMVLALVNAKASDQPLSVPFIETLASVVVASLYHDWRSSLTS